MIWSAQIHDGRSCIVKNAIMRSLLNEGAAICEEDLHSSALPQNYINRRTKDGGDEIPIND